ncbi:hypothetical protein CDV31_014522 [Fusarium ambrosium]|uniref:Uncharacterized protein n=1 Tax=Fusarium ambrosium TaxID=131363 RepID=A0A428SVN6_9HYPO|nr:hypothetical protein CDV31_014522 [Fusarium ambrosium]
MFDLPEAKRVRREDLNGSDDGSESDDGIQDAELRARLNAQIAKSLGLDDSFAQPAADLIMGDSHLAGPKGSGDEEAGGSDSPDGAGEDAEEEFAFRLFSSAPAAQKVVLEEDVEPTGDGEFVRGRPLSYYVVTNLPAKQKQQYAYAAVSGDQVLERSHVKAWGLELPWKVTTITVTRKAKPGEKTGDEASKSKRRPGKKQRISLRKKSKAKEDKKAAEVQRLTEKEEHIKDKKKRLNRLKKLRKRAKAREQKQAGKGEGGDSDDDSAGSE